MNNKNLNTSAALYSLLSLKEQNHAKAISNNFYKYLENISQEWEMYEETDIPGILQIEILRDYLKFKELQFQHDNPEKFVFNIEKVNDTTKAVMNSILVNIFMLSLNKHLDISNIFLFDNKIDEFYPLDLLELVTQDFKECMFSMDIMSPTKKDIYTKENIEDILRSIINEVFNFPFIYNLNYVSGFGLQQILKF